MEMPPLSSEEEPAGILCPSCVASNLPRAEFCLRCGAPLGMMATIDPLKSTFSEGFAYRRAVDGPPSKLVLIGIWVIFAPGLLIFPFQSKDTPSLLFFTLSAALSVLILYRVTANYMRKRAVERESSLT